MVGRARASGETSNIRPVDGRRAQPATCDLPMQSAVPGKLVLRGLLVGLAAGWCGALALASGAAAAPAWVPAQNVSDPVTGPGSVITDVQLAGDPAGNTIAVWKRFDEREEPDNDIDLIEAAFRP